MAAHTWLCLHLEWRPGDTVSATDWQPAMEKLWRQPTIRERLWLNRGDSGFGQEAILAGHEGEGEKRPKYLFKLKLTTKVRRAITRVHPADYTGWGERPAPAGVFPGFESD